MKNIEKDILNKYANKIVNKNLSVPAIFFLESTKYISFVGGQMLIFLGPFLTVFINEKDYYKFVELLEERNNIEFLICSIEKLQPDQAN